MVPPRPPAAPAAPPQGSPPIAVLALVLVNLAPLVGVAFFEWSIFDLMTLYWFENGVIGLFALLKILLTEGRDDDAPSGCMALPHRLFIAAFFTVHYGAFWTGHGFFVAMLFGPGAGFGSGAIFDAGGPFGVAMGPRIAADLLQGGMLLTAMALVVSHGVSFVANVLVRGEDLTLPPNVLMFRPYGRVVILHVTLLIGGFLVMGLGEALAVLVLFVALKIAVDLWSHRRAHRPRSGLATPPTTS